jgi:hypothetical protein
MTLALDVMSSQGRQRSFRSRQNSDHCRDEGSKLSWAIFEPVHSVPPRSGFHGARWSVGVIVLPRRELSRRTSSSRARAAHPIRQDDRFGQLAGRAVDLLPRDAACLGFACERDDLPLGISIAERP